MERQAPEIQIPPALGSINTYTPSENSGPHARSFYRDTACTMAASYHDPRRASYHPGAEQYDPRPQHGYICHASHIQHKEDVHEGKPCLPSATASHIHGQLSRRLLCPSSLMHAEARASRSISLRMESAPGTPGVHMDALVCSAFCHLLPRKKPCGYPLPCRASLIFTFVSLTLSQWSHALLRIFVHSRKNFTLICPEAPEPYRVPVHAASVPSGPSCRCRRQFPPRSTFPDISSEERSCNPPHQSVPVYR